MPPWSPGKSGNPKGRPKKKTLGELIYAEGLKKVSPEMAKELGTPEFEKISNAEALVVIAYQHALRGKFNFLQEIVSRVDGKVPIPISIEGDITVDHEFDVTQLTDAELEAAIAIRRKALRISDSRQSGNGSGAA